VRNFSENENFQV